ncbi:transcription factor IIIB 90 kDa subunit [Elysia marginata]|uniref:Transcription factor IIIB 90 kDa subunit n=1 Tax=Elysia marginata TaxID=1093978 RepID=A0AAV4FRR6_9GAST|nr:transcription factor IIIB 90 kDa subunit [Elysia marginata]
MLFKELCCSTEIHPIAIPNCPQLCAYLAIQSEISSGLYKPHSTWRETLAEWELALCNRHMRDWKRWSERTKRLPPLKVGDHIRIQNQIGPNPLKWDKTGKVIEVRQFDQYVVKVDGLGRVTLQNRKFLRQYSPVIPYPPTKSIAIDIPIPTPLSQSTAPTIPIDTIPPKPPTSNNRSHSQIADRPWEPKYHNTTYIARRHKVHSHHTTSITLRDCTPGHPYPHTPNI